MSPVNAAIYGVDEPALAPVEDLALSVEDFEALCRDGVLKPHARHLILKPHVRLWRQPRPAPRARSGHVEIEGFLPNSVLRLAGYKLDPEQALTEEEAQKKLVLGMIELSLVKFLNEKFPDCQVTLSPVTLLRNG